MNSSFIINRIALKSFALFLLFSLFSFNSFSQAPSTSPVGDPAGSQLTPGASCNPVTWNAPAIPAPYWVPDGTCGATASPFDIWGWFDATSALTNIVYTPLGATDAIVHVFDGGVGGAIPPAPNMVSLACSNAGGVLITETINLVTVVGRRYRIRVQTPGAPAIGTLCVYNGSVGPANDDCANAEVIDCSTNNLAGSTVGASTLDSFFTGCGLGFDGVWYTFTGDGQEWTISTTGSGGFDQEMAISEGTCAGLTRIACVDDFGSNGTETYTFITTNATTYYVYVADFFSSSSIEGDFTISVSCSAAPPPPPNDDPCGALALTVNPDFLCGNVTVGTVSNASDTGVNDCLGVENNDVWFYFQAPAGGAVTVDLLNVTGGVDMNHAVFGPFATVAGVDCVPANVSAQHQYCSDPNSSTATGLVAGQYYFIQVNTYFLNTSSATFDVCIGSPPPPPSNDAPCGATALTMNADLACGVVTPGTILSALPGIAGLSTCSGNENDDVWYSFVATSTSHVVTLSNIVGTTTNLNHAVYGPFANAGVCAPATVAGAAIINCSDLNTSITGGLVPGQTYFVQVYSSGSGTYNTTFDVCVGTPPTVANDEPCGALAAPFILPVNGDFLCTLTTSGTVEWATDSLITGCGGISDDDVWYSFVATNTSHSVNLLNVSGPTTAMYIGIYDGGPGCANATVNGNNLVCSNTDATSFPTVIGNTYFVQIYTTNGTANPSTIFDICVGTPPPAPANDGPCGAVALTVNQACIPTTGSVASATNSGIDSCLGSPDDDVWYVFTATSTNHTITLENIFGSNTDMYHAVYGGFSGPACVGLNTGDNISCSDNNTSILSGLTIGDNYFIQVFTFTSTPGQTTTFDICVTEPCTNLGSVNTTPTVCPLIGAGTGSDPFLVTPFDPDPVASIDCLTDTVTLEAYSNINETTSYIVEQIPNPVSTVYNPPGFSTPVSVPFDDRWADSRSTLPFNFCYYGTTYTDLIIGSNGQVSFDSANVANTFCAWQINNDAPSTAGALYDNTIYGVLQDLYPVGMTNPIKTWTEGTAPCRTFNIAFLNIPLFSDSTRTYTGKVVLYETTNIIEIYIQQKLIENGNVNPWNGGNAAVGIQGVGEAVIPPCRNALDDNWEATNEAWRFVPTGTAIAPDSVTWFDSLGSNIGTGTTVSVNAEDTYLVQANYTVCGASISITDNIVVGKSSKTWTGAVSTNWYDPDNWVPLVPNSIPSAIDCVIIPDVSAGSNRYPVADLTNTAPLPPQPSYGLNLTIEAGATLEIASGTSLVIQDYIDNDGVINVRDTGSIIQINNGAINVNNNVGGGVINMERTVAGVGAYDYIYWSSPVESFGVTGISPLSTYIYEWDPTIPANLNGYGDWLGSAEIMQPGKGYIVRNIDGTAIPNTPVFTGKPNNGRITRDITRGTYNGGAYFTPSGAIATRDDDNWNLVGNPYPSALDASAFITRNATAAGGQPVISGALYLWRHLAAPSTVEANPFYGDFVYNYNPNDYMTVNSTGSTPAGFNGSIAAGQAFFVLMRNDANASTSYVWYDNTMRNETLDNSVFYRTEEPIESTSESEKNRIWLDLISPDNLANSILIGYVENATNGFDHLYDARELSETSARFYSIIGASELSIQGRALPFNDTDSVPLGIDIPQNGNYTIAINTLDGLFLDTEQKIYLEDTYNGIIHDLRVNPYSFNADEGVYDDRFIIRYDNESLSIDEFNSSNLEIIAPNNEFIKVKTGNSTINSVTLYDLLGRVLIDRRDINNSEVVLETNNYADGPYIVKAVLIDGKQKIQKVVIKN